MIKSNDVELTVNSDHLRVSPGEEVQLTVTVHNDSPAIDVFRLEVNGLEDQWGRPDVLAQMLRPHPGRPEDPHRDCLFESNLTIKPPRNSSAVAGDRRLEIKATRDRNPLQEAVTPVTLEVLPFYAFDLDLTPQRYTGARGTYSLTITNNGNHELNFDLKARDPEELCQFSFDQISPRVLPGETISVALKVEPAQRPFRGRPKPYAFTVTATPRLDGLDAKDITGTLNATSRSGQTIPRLVSALRHPIGTPSIPSFPVPTWVWLVCGLALITVIAVGIIFLISVMAGGDAQTAQFEINPGGDTSFVLALPDSRVVRIEGEAQWQGSGGDLEVDLLRPDGTRSVSFVLSPSAPDLTFTIDEELVGHGPEGWLLSLHNSSDIEQARGTLRISTSEVQ